MTMRCVDVIEELALPTPDGADPTALADHLAHCPRCSAWARRDAQLARLWEATRPEEPSAITWTTMWDQVMQAVESGTVPQSSAVAQLPQTALARPWQRRTFALFAVAQAAVLLVGTWLVWRSNVVWPAPPMVPQPGTAVAMPTKVEIPYGATVMIHTDLKEFKSVNLAANEGFGAGAVDSMFGMLGTFEAMAE